MTETLTQEKAAELVSLKAGYTVRPEYVHIIRIDEIPSVFVIGEHVTTHRGEFRGVYVDGTMGSAEDQAAASLAKGGWGSADSEKRSRLALVWAEQVVCRFAGTACHDPVRVFGKNGRPEFSPPQSLLTSSGGAEVRFWLRDSGEGKTSPVNFRKIYIIFGPDGSIESNTFTDSFSVTSTEYFESLPGPG